MFFSITAYAISLYAVGIGAINIFSNVAGSVVLFFF